MYLSLLKFGTIKKEEIQLCNTRQLKNFGSRKKLKKKFLN